MGKSRGEIAFYVILIFSLIMVNPPVLGYINDFAKSTPMIFGFPTLWIWLELWFGIAIIDFFVAATFIKAWKKEF